jgi:hypothetical protein
MPQITAGLGCISRRSRDSPDRPVPGPLDAQTRLLEFTPPRSGPFRSPSRRRDPALVLRHFGDTRLPKWLVGFRAGDR